MVLEKLDLGSQKIAKLALKVPKVFKRLIFFRVVETLHAADIVANVEHLGFYIIILEEELFLDFLNVVVELLECVGSGGLVLLDVGLQRLETVGQVLNISPSAIGLCTLDALAHHGLLCEVTVVEVSVVPQQER